MEIDLTSAVVAVAAHVAAATGLLNSRLGGGCIAVVVAACMESLSGTMSPVSILLLLSSLYMAPMYARGQQPDRGGFMWGSLHIHGPPVVLVVVLRMS